MNQPTWTPLSTWDLIWHHDVLGTFLCMYSLEPRPLPPKGLVHTVHACTGFSHFPVRSQWLVNGVGLCFYDKLAHAYVYKALIWIRPGCEASVYSRACDWGVL